MIYIYLKLFKTAFEQRNKSDLWKFLLYYMKQKDPHIETSL